MFDQAMATNADVHSMSVRANLSLAYPWTSVLLATPSALAALLIAVERSLAPERWRELSISWMGSALGSLELLALGVAPFAILAHGWLIVRQARRPLVEPSRIGGLLPLLAFILSVGAFLFAYVQLRRAMIFGE